jgi:hypothetical protein
VLTLALPVPLRAALQAAALPTGTVYVRRTPPRSPTGASPASASPPPAAPSPPQSGAVVAAALVQALSAPRSPSVSPTPQGALPVAKHANRLPAARAAHLPAAAALRARLSPPC